ncbi:family 20 glycosylhydrolase [Nonomuraea sp. NPDC050536]|uniref:family 20 glycosylhydrolase n=1 Tax=Nonomuraea sp. NPDC050536 TaxID=3364366 RepID=UPI0037CB125B
MTRVLALLALLASLLVTTTPAQAATMPQTIPALREWAAGPSPFTFGTSTRILVDPASAVLDDEAATFADDLAALMGRRPAVQSASRSQAAPGDLYLALGSTDTQLGDQGYTMEVGGFVAITARTEAGAFLGTRSVLQLLRQSPTITGGVARDWPSYPERGIRIDAVPRKYSATWWHDLIRELSYLKLNQLQTGLLGGEGLSDAEIDDLIAYTVKYHIEFIPTVAIPSHSDPIVVEHPDLRLLPQPVAGVSLDFSKPGALDVVKSYIERYVDRFPGRYWHTSGDEFLVYPAWKDAGWQNYPQLAEFVQQQTGKPAATARDAFVWFLNWVDDLLKPHHKTLRVWNDHLEGGGVVKLNPDIVVEDWINAQRPTSLTPQQIVDAGNKIFNVSESFLYHDMADRTINAQNVYDNFRPTLFNEGLTVSDSSRVLGAMAAVWLGDRGPDKVIESNEFILDKVTDPLRALAQVTWESPKPGAYSAFAALGNALGHAPGYQQTAGIVAGRPAWLPGGSGYLVRTSAGNLEFGQPAKYDNWSHTTIATGIAGDPVVSAGPRFAVRSTSGQLLYGYRDASGWHVSPVISGVAGTPALDGDVWFARLTNGELWTGSPSAAAVRLTTGIAGDPVAIKDVNGKLTYFARTTAGALRHGWQTSAGGSWDPVVADLVTDTVGQPAVSLDVNGKLTLFVRKSNGDLVHRWQGTPGGGWYPGEAVLVTGAAGDPVVALDVSQKLTLFVRRSNGDLVHRWQATAGGAWDPLTYILMSGTTGDPVVVKDSANRLAAFATRPGGSLWHRWQNVAGGAWAAEKQLFAPQLSGNAAVTLAADGRLTYLAATTDAYLVRGWQTTPADSTAWRRWIVLAS